MTKQLSAEARREATFLLAPVEKRVLPWLARRLPSWVLPDHLTAVGVIAAVGIMAGYLLSNQSVLWLWLVNVCLVLHWLGDSLDGTVARVRRIERPKYGYYLDHLVDGVAMTLIGLGLGFSPYMLVASGMLLVIMYLLLSINVYLEASTLGLFRIGYGLVGPTEGRVLLVIVNLTLLSGYGLSFHFLGVKATMLDAVALIASLVMAVLLVGRAHANLRRLAVEEPSGNKRHFKT